MLRGIIFYVIKCRVGYSSHQYCCCQFRVVFHVLLSFLTHWLSSSSSADNCNHSTWEEMRKTCSVCSFCVDRMCIWIKGNVEGGRSKANKIMQWSSNEFVFFAPPCQAVRQAVGRSDGVSTLQPPERAQLMERMGTDIKWLCVMSDIVAVSWGGADWSAVWMLIEN